MRIAFVITELNVGGAERCLVNLATGLPRPQCKCAVYSLGPAPPQGAARQLVDQLARCGIPIHFLDGTSPWQYHVLRRRLTGALRKQRPDLVQTFLFHSNVLGIQAARRAGHPLAVAGIRVADPRAWRVWLERRVLKHSQRIVCVSDAVARYAAERMRLPQAQLVTIPNGIDLARYASASPADLTPAGVERDRRVLLYVGRLDRQKGLDWLLQVAPRLLEHRPQHDLVLAGEGPLRDWILHEAARRQLAHRIHLLGWRNDVPNLLRRAELLLLPSRWEGMPNVVLEAMAARVPVVAARVEGVEQLLGPRADRQTVPFGNDDALLEHVSILLDDATGRAQLADHNALRVEREFSQAAMVESYYQLYRILVAENARTTGTAARE